MHKEFKQSFSKWQIIRGEQMPMGSKGWNEVPGILKGRWKYICRMRLLSRMFKPRGCSFPKFSDFVDFDMKFCSLFTYIPQRNRSCSSFQSGTDFFRTSVLDGFAGLHLFLLSPQGCVLSQDCQDMTFLTVSLLIIYYLYPVYFQ